MQKNRSDIVTNGCNGSCCAKFHLPFTPEEFAAIRQAWENYKFNCILRIHALAFGEEKAQYRDIKWIDRNGNERNIPDPTDIEYITDMIIFIGYDINSAQSGVDMTEEFKRQNPDIEPHDGVGNGHVFREGQLLGIYYTCKHFDKENRICTQYDSRPRLCKWHGVGNKCGYTGCNLKFITDVVCDNQGSVQSKDME